MASLKARAYSLLWEFEHHHGLTSYQMNYDAAMAWDTINDLLNEIERLEKTLQENKGSYTGPCL